MILMLMLIKVSTKNSPPFENVRAKDEDKSSTKTRKVNVAHTNSGNSNYRGRYFKYCNDLKVPLWIVEHLCVVRLFKLRSRESRRLSTIVADQSAVQPRVKRRL